MRKSRLEAFSDGVIAIIITIMVLEIKVPHTSDINALEPVLPIFLSYLLSFIYVGIYWNNHHHMFQLVKEVNGKVLWKNMHLLFWLSLIPFSTGWMGENHFNKWPVILYGAILMMCAIAFGLLVNDLMKLHGQESSFAAAIGQNMKGKLSIIFYLVGIPLTFVHAWLGLFMYIIVACVWFVPDTRVEKKLVDNTKENKTI